jgi:hypothetical protein
MMIYIMAMFNFNCDLIDSLNAFNGLDKNRYLSYKDRSKNFVFDPNLYDLNKK